MEYSFTKRRRLSDFHATAATLRNARFPFVRCAALETLESISEAPPGEGGGLDEWPHHFDALVFFSAD